MFKDISFIKGLLEDSVHHLDNLSNKHADIVGELLVKIESLETKLAKAEAALQKELENLK